MSRLTDDEVSHWTDAMKPESPFGRALAELRSRRAADLTAEDVEALRWARSLIDEAYRAWHGHRWQYDGALSAIDKLTRGGGK